jgi:hypothetical protein
MSSRWIWKISLAEIGVENSGLYVSSANAMLSKNADHATDQSADRCAAPSAYESRQVAIVAGANCTFESLTQLLFPTSLKRMSPHGLQVA